ncbi:MAG: hypothetical protein ACK4VZ_01680 [Paracoccaceae bacterium]
MTPGTSNQAFVDQANGAGNAAGRADLLMRQAGMMNKINVVQSGNQNTIGLQEVAPNAGFGVLQASDTVFGTNRTNIIQSSDRNQIGSVSQIAQGAGLEVVGNDLMIEQGLANTSLSDDNRIGTVQQTRIGAVQGNVAVLRQAGGQNIVQKIAQFATGPGAGTQNRIELLQQGNGNGTSVLSGRAAEVGAFGGQFIQGSPSSASHGNQLFLTIFGDGNQAGTVQQGIGNTIGDASAAIISGQNNQLGVLQSGLENRLSVLVLGDENNIGARQVGVGNSIAASVALGGTDNNFLLEQVGSDNQAVVSVTGDLNAVSLLQDGLGNVSMFSTIGNQNAISGKQSGSVNLATVSQNGNLNIATFSQHGGFNSIAINQ